METCQYTFSPISVLLLPKSSVVKQTSLALRNFKSISSGRAQSSVNRRHCFRRFCQPQITLFVKFKLRLDNRLHFSPLTVGPSRTYALERRRFYSETTNRWFSCNAIGADAEQCEEKDSQEDAQGTVQIKADTVTENAQNHVLGRQNQTSQLQKRVIFGLAIGVSVGAFVLAGGWFFTVGLALAILVGTREYFELVRSHGIAAGMTPPPRYVSRVCSAICAVMPLMTMYFGGRMGVAVTSSAFFLAIVLFLQRGSPRFAQLSSIIFGLFYCGYLPSFWVKLRCGLAVPALNTKIGALWPVLLGGQAQWTVGLVATLMSFSSIIAADTGAFLGGKTFGRTPLTSVSPKKTWEGAFAGFSSSLAVTIVLSKILSWPTSFLGAFAFALLNFLGSIFGDLIESMIKRDAGVKDSGHLIPGHGGLLDRVDSYLFTGALVYSFVKIGLPLYGV